MFQAASAPPNGLGLVSVVQNVDGCGKNVPRTPNYSISNPERNDEIVTKTDLDTLAGHFRLVRSRMRPMGGDSTCRSPCHARKRGPNVRDRYRGSPARNRSTKNRKKRSGNLSRKNINFENMLHRRFEQTQPYFAELSRNLSGKQTPLCESIGPELFRTPKNIKIGSIEPKIQDFKVEYIFRN